MSTNNSVKRNISSGEAIIKAQKFCAYRDRCTSEVLTKLKEWNLPEADYDGVIDELVESDFINDKRYVVAFARGKFNNNHWGRFKIKMALSEKKISPELIEEGLKKIEEGDYLKTAKKLIERKWLELKGVDERMKKSKVYYYMLSRGFEPDFTIKLIDSIK